MITIAIYAIIYLVATRVAVVLAQFGYALPKPGATLIILFSAMLAGWYYVHVNKKAPDTKNSLILAVGSTAVSMAYILYLHIAAGLPFFFFVIALQVTTILATSFVTYRFITKNFAVKTPGKDR